jgi:hypothetical protein
LLREHKDEVLAMGYDSIAELGLHSIWKGVCTYMASLPGGPPPAALCLHSGHSMGPVKDTTTKVKVEMNLLIAVFQCLT